MTLAELSVLSVHPSKSLLVQPGAIIPRSHYNLPYDLWLEIKDLVGSDKPSKMCHTHLNLRCKIEKGLENKFCAKETYE